MEFVDAFTNNKDNVDAATDFLAKEQSIMKDLEAEIDRVTISKKPVTEVPNGNRKFNYAGQLSYRVNDLELSTESFEETGGEINMNETLISKNQESEPNIIKTSKREDYLSWDEYFMATAQLSSQRSKDPSTQVGACIVDTNKRIVAIGYNGFPRGCSDDQFPWGKPGKGEQILDDKRLFVVHAEANAILNGNTTNLVGTTLYTTLFPCNECTKLIIQSGIKKIWYLSDKYADKIPYQAAKLMLKSANIEFRPFTPVRKQIVIDFNKNLSEDLKIISC